MSMSFIERRDSFRIRSLFCELLIGFVSLGYLIGSSSDSSLKISMSFLESSETDFSLSCRGACLTCGVSSELLDSASTFARVIVFSVLLYLKL
jgi:hypothetical protein